MMPRNSREQEITKSIREFLIGAVKQVEPITDERLMKAVKCSRATFYKYVIKGSTIETEIEVARTDQKRYAQSVSRNKDNPPQGQELRKRLEESEESKRGLLAFITRLTANLIVRGVRTEIIQAAQQEAISHPNRTSSHAGKGSGRRRYR